MSSTSLAHLSPGRIILLSVFITIAMGTLLLALPIARTAPIPFLDLIFTATSAACVTGLFTINLTLFTLFGKAVLLALIQIGGLGLITLTVFVLSLFVDLGFAAQLFAGHVMEIETWKNIRKIIVFIISITLAAEIIGAIVTFICIHAHYTLRDALFLSLFHSVSSFCNAGISILDHAAHPHIMLEAHYPLLIITTLLMFSGSLGFITWIEIIGYCKALYNKKRFSFSLVSKIALYGSITLTIIGTLLFLILEGANAFAHMSPIGKIINAIFNAVSLRSTGLLSVPITALQMPSLLFIMVMAFIGSAPGSTGSGIKLTSLFILFSTIKSAISGYTSVNIKGRRIPKDQVLKAITIVTLSACWIISVLFCLLITQTNIDFMDLTFETISALTNLGLSLGITPLLAISSKIFIMLSMIAGRIGSLTLILAFRKTTMQVQAADKINYPEERVMLS